MRETVSYIPETPYVFSSVGHPCRDAVISLSASEPTRVFRGEIRTSLCSFWSPFGCRGSDAQPPVDPGPPERALEFAAGSLPQPDYRMSAPDFVL